MKSKFNFFQVYLLSFFMLSFLLLGLYFLLHPEIQLKSKLGNTYSASIAGAFIFIVGILLFYLSLKYVFHIKIENQTIYIRSLFSKKVIAGSEIHSIDLLANRNLGMATNATFCTVISLQDGEKVVLGDVFYRNKRELKKCIEVEFKSKVISQTESLKKTVSISSFNEEPEKFAGNQFTSLNGIIFYGMSIFFFVMFYNAQRISFGVGFGFCVSLIGIFYLAFGNQMHYFLVSNNTITIKNHFWFWYSKEYSLENVLQVNFETPFKQSNAMRITLTDYKSKAYSAGSLRDEHWASLKEKLKETGVFVRK